MVEEKSNSVSAQPRRVLSLFGAVCVIVGTIIGSGIFATAPAIAQNANRFEVLIGLWVLGGIVSLVGAMCFAELMTTNPNQVGGDYVYLKKAYVRPIAFVFAWAAFWIIRPGNIGAMSMIFAQYFEQIRSIGPNSQVIYALAAVVGLSVTILLGLKTGKGVQNFLTSAKVLGIIAIVVLAVLKPAEQIDFSMTSSKDDSLWLAMILVMFTYGGWNNIASLNFTKITFAFFLAVLCLIPGKHSYTVAQVTFAENGAAEIPARLLHDFKNVDGELIVMGQFVKFETGTVTVRLADHTMDELKAADLCDEDRKWVRQQQRKAIRNEKKASEARKVLGTMHINKPRTVATGASELRRFGRNASHVADRVLAMMASVDDDKAKAACLYAYPRICDPSWQSLDRIYKHLNQNKHDARDLALKNPERFLKSLASLDYLALPFITHVANRCELTTEPDWQDTAFEPVELKFSDGQKSELRLAAINALGEFESEEAGIVLLDLAPLVERAALAGKKDEQLVALLKSLGNVGLNNSEVISLMKRHYKTHPDTVKEAMKRIKKKSGDNE